MLFGEWKEKLAVEGTMPERALLRLKRAGIAVYDVKKTGKTQIVLQVKKKDVEKVFAIYPNVCYNISEYSPYTVKKLGATGALRVAERLKNRVGLLLGGLAFVALTLFANSFVFGVDVVGASAYKREAMLALEEGGVKLFSPYKGGKEDEICAQILALDDVEFCSVKKQGMRVRVEIRTAKFNRPSFTEGKMQAKHTGEIVALTVLRGTALKKVGEKITAGETLVEEYFQAEEGGQVRVEVIARVQLACTYEEEIAAESEEEAFAQAYLAVGLTEKDELIQKEVEKRENGYFVRLSYTAIETKNF